MFDQDTNILYTILKRCIVKKTPVESEEMVIQQVRARRLMTDYVRIWA